MATTGKTKLTKEVTEPVFLIMNSLVACIKNELHNYETN